MKDFLPVCDVIDHAAQIPTLALCGSHQLLGFLYNGKVRTATKLYDEPIRNRKPGEPPLAELAPVPKAIRRRPRQRYSRPK